jgi:beta-galactosidase GanA
MCTLWDPGGRTGPFRRAPVSAAGLAALARVAAPAAQGAIAGGPVASTVDTRVPGPRMLRVPAHEQVPIHHGGCHMAAIRRVFQVDGKPFFSLGGQSRNSSGYNRDEAETAFKAVKLLHGNTLEIPVYWEQVEPVEGQYDWSSVETLLAMAREYKVRLVLLWFGTWKNGNMEYVPAWVKANPDRFRRVTNPFGNTVWVLSSHCEATRQADERAFVGLMAHLRDHDAQGTVIAVQIENEPGILGSDRDYGPEAQATFDAPVPAELVSRMQAAGKGLQARAACTSCGSRRVANPPARGPSYSARRPAN